MSKRTSEPEIYQLAQENSRLFDGDPSNKLTYWHSA